jgi:hypothetical protein
MIKNSFLIALGLLSIAICSFAFAADSEVTLDTTDSSSGFTVKDSLGDPVMSARGDGNVGIGTTSPGEKLEVSGNLKVTGSIIGAPDYIWIRDEKPSGTPGGSFPAGSWLTRDLTVEKTDIGGHATLSSNQIILASGTYRISAHAPGQAVGNHQIRLYNITNSTTIIAGTSAYGSTVGEAQQSSFIRGQFSLATTKTLELQHRCSLPNSGGDHLGVAVSFGEVNVYSEVELWRIGD